MNRREFLARAVVSAPLFIPERAFGANDRISYGVIGTGGRGRYLNQNFQKLGEQCVALCDVYGQNSSVTPIHSRMAGPSPHG